MTGPGPTRRVSRRARRQVVLAIASVILLAGIYALVESEDRMFAWSMATAYASTALLILALIVGPWRVLRGAAPSVNSGLRRDLGIWGGILGVAHVAVGLQVHFRGRPWLYFVPEPERRGAVLLRTDLFGFANYTGLVATVLLIILLALSNDRALRRLGAARWKRWQRLNYAGMALIAVHGVAYQVIEDRIRTPLFIALLAVLVLSSVALQLAGYRRIRAET